MPALTRHHLAESIPRVGASAGTEHLISTGKQFLTLTGHAKLEPGGVLETAAAPLMHTPLETCITDLLAPNLAPPIDSFVNRVDEPRVDLASSSRSHVHTLWALLDQLSILLMKCFNADQENLGIGSANVTPTSTPFA